MAMSRVLGLVVVALAIGACGGGGSGDAEDPPATPSQSAPTSERTPASSTVDAAADLSDFVCGPDEDGEWSASGVITNSTGRSADYRVTVVVTDGSGGSLPGKRRVLTALAPGAPEPFEVKNLPASGATDSTCQVEVLRMP
jgi:hypothetical protein